MRALCLALCFCVLASPATGPALAQDMRVITGNVVVLERMALPDQTVLIVDASDATDSMALSQRVATQGAQSPFAFQISVPSGQPFILRAGLRADDDMIWLTEPRLIDGDSAPLDLGDLRAARTPAMGYAALLICGTQMVEIGFLPEEVRLRFNEQVLTLRAQPSEAGALYVAPDNPATTIQLNANTGLLTVDGATLAECALVRSEQDITTGVWNISTIAEKPAIFPSRTELVFFPDGRVSASVGCNRFIGGYRRHGGFLSIGRVASTRMGCPDGLAEQEALFSAKLGQIDGYSVSSDGTRLTLTAVGVAVLQARR